GRSCPSPTSTRSSLLSRTTAPPTSSSCPSPRSCTDGGTRRARACRRVRRGTRHRLGRGRRRALALPLHPGRRRQPHDRGGHARELRGSSRAPGDVGGGTCGAARVAVQVPPVAFV